MLLNVDVHVEMPIAYWMVGTCYKDVFLEVSRVFPVCFKDAKKSSWCMAFITATRAQGGLVL